MLTFTIGQFVAVGESIGIIVAYPVGKDIPEEHLAVWFGEIRREEGKLLPNVRTVPEEYCIPVDGMSLYH